MLQRHIVLLSLHCGCDYTFLCTMERQINSRSAACRSEGGTKQSTSARQAWEPHSSVCLVCLGATGLGHGCGGFERVCCLVRGCSSWHAAAGRACRGLDVDEAPAGLKHHTHGAEPKAAAAKVPRSSRLLALPFSWPLGTLARLDLRGLRTGLLPRTKPSRWARGIPVAQSL